MTQPRKISIVIVTYNAVPYLDGCLSAVNAADKGPHAVETIVIDNASKDGTADAIAARYPWAALIRNASNLGFAGGNNVGLRRALASGSDYVYLLNQDTEAAPSFLTEAVIAAEADAKAGSAQSLLLLHPRKDLINSTGNAIHFLGFGYCRDQGRPLASWRPPARPEIAYGSGAGALYRSSALRQVGLLDEALFLYHEDLDLGWRLRLAGWRNILAPASVVYHKYEFSRSIAKFYYMERNRYLVLFRNCRLWTLILLLPWLVLSELGLALVAIRSGWWREKLKVYGYFLKPAAWKHVAKGRRENAGYRAVGDREIFRLFTPVIAFQEVSGPFTRYVANPLMTALWFFLRFLIV